MKKLLLVAAIAVAARASGQSPGNDAARWEQQARSVTIIRDDWGIAHVYGKTDADAVFGMIYAQAEDDFNRVEANYLTSLGRTAEAEGESKIWQDLRMRLIIEPRFAQGRVRVESGVAQVADECLGGWTQLLSLRSIRK